MKQKSKSAWTMAIVAIVATLCGCGGKNGLVGGGQGNSVFLQSISMTPMHPTVSLNTPPQAPSKLQFVVIGQYNVGSPKEITDQMTWTSRDAKVATVDAKGTAIATGSGKVVISAEIFEPATQKVLHAETMLTVVPQLAGITVGPSATTMAKGTVHTFTATGQYNDGTNVDISALVSWSSSQPAVATVSSSPGTQGKVTGVAPGLTEVTAFLGSWRASASLAVTDANLRSLTVTPANPTVPLSGIRQFTATGTFDDGTTQDLTDTVTWTSSKPAIARAASTGLVVGMGLGTANIRADLDSFTSSSDATVDASSVKRVSVLPRSKIASGTRAQMRAEAILNDGSVLDITQIAGVEWSSSNLDVASITANSGQLETKSPGAITISAKLGSQSGNTSVSVSDASIRSLAVGPNQVIVAPGTEQPLMALATFVDGTEQFQQDVSRSAAWSSDNTAIAVVSLAHGFQQVANAVAPGTVNISASFADSHGNHSVSAVVLNVSNATVDSISVSPGKSILPTGGWQQFAATGNFSDGTTQDLTLAAGWSTDDTAVARVSDLGSLWAAGPGQTSISATLGGQSGSSAVLVNPAALVKIDICPADTPDPFTNCPLIDPIPPPPPLSLPARVPFGFVAIGTFVDGTRQDLTSSVQWQSSDPAIGGISNDPGMPGIATGIPGQGFALGFAAGHVTLTATVSGIAGTLDVTVTNASPQFLTVTPADSTIQLGLGQQMAAKATFSDNTVVDVTRFAEWTISDPSVAILSDAGFAYSIGTGTATATARFGGVPGSTTLAVQ